MSEAIAPELDLSSDLSFPLKRSAVLVMDCQNDIINEKGRLTPYGTLPNSLVPNLQAIIAAARLANIPVIFVRHASRPDYADGQRNFPMAAFIERLGALREGEWGSQIIDDIAPRPSEFVVTKNRGSAFYGSTLESILRDHDITHLALMGISTAAVVSFTLYDALDRGYFITVIEDGCATTNQSLHDLIVREVFPPFAQVCNTADFIAAVGSK